MLLCEYRSDMETQNKRIIIIEDQEVLADLIQGKLERAGHSVKIAYEGVSGLDLVRAEKPDLVLLDMGLPRLDGFGILEALHADGTLPALPIIIISNTGQPVEVDRAQKLGVRDYLIKVNFNPDELIEKVNRMFSEQMPAPASSSGKSDGPVLIIDDELFFVQLLEHKFQSEGFMTYHAMDANQARDVLENSHVQILLLDIVMPGTDGLTFLRQIKAEEKWKHLPVIIISNLSQEEEIRKGMDAGAADYIVKAHAVPGEIVRRARAILRGEQPAH